MPTERLIAQKSGPIGWLIFNNPARRNALSVDMWEGMPEILDAYADDPEVRLVVLRGAGEKAFVAGADISQFEDQRASTEAVAHYDEMSRRALISLQRIDKPTIAMIRGFCIGGGLNVAMSCDLRIAASDAKLAIPAARLGLGYAYEGVKKLVSLVGPAFAKEIYFTARQFDAEEAHQMGLVNRVVASEMLDSTIQGMAAAIADNAPLTIKSTKLSVDTVAAGYDAPDLAAVQAAIDACFASQDYVEGRRAFMEKRRPVFRGL
jgi:enoyl-CoA hydratase/carnithine racemase